MNYGYIRVSTDKQAVENQRFEILQFCARENIEINDWIEETISELVDFPPMATSFGTKSNGYPAAKYVY